MCSLNGLNLVELSSHAIMQDLGVVELDAWHGVFAASPLSCLL
jgi:hypothetical protein